MTKKLSLKAERLSADDLVVIGRAPICGNCLKHMVPLNRDDDPDRCRCPKCGREAQLQRVASA